LLFGEAQNSPVLSSPDNQPFANRSVISPAKKYLVWYFPAGKFPGSIKLRGRHCGAQPGISVVPESSELATVAVPRHTSAAVATIKSRFMKRSSA
jgi:hypothetical protein